MSRTLIPAAANIICEHGSHILLIKRSKNADTWPLHWAFPWWKLEDDELFRECAIRETREEIGIHFTVEDIISESFVMTRTVSGTKLFYFANIRNYENVPEILEPNLIDDMAWFSLDELPDLLIPHHRIALEVIQSWKSYIEFDVAP